MPDSYAIGWNTNNYNYWDTKDFIRPIYTKSVVINRKPKPRPKQKNKDEE